MVKKLRRLRPMPEALVREGGEIEGCPLAGGVAAEADGRLWLVARASLLFQTVTS